MPFEFNNRDAKARTEKMSQTTARRREEATGTQVNPIQGPNSSSPGVVSPCPGRTSRVLCALGQTYSPPTASIPLFSTRDYSPLSIPFNYDQNAPPTVYVYGPLLLCVTKQSVSITVFYELRCPSVDGSRLDESRFEISLKVKYGVFVFV